LSDYGIPIGSDGKSNWAEIRDKFYSLYKNKNYEQQSVSSLEKIIQYFRMRAFKAIREAEFGDKP